MGVNKQYFMETEYIIPVCYDDVFSDKPLEAEDYIKLIPREYAIRIGLFLSNLTEKVSPLELLNQLNLSQYLSHLILLKLKGEHLPNATHVLSTVNTGLELLRVIFALDSQKFIPRQNMSIIATSLLKAILKINTDYVSKLGGLSDTASELFSKRAKFKKYDADDRIAMYANVYKSLRLLEFFIEHSTGDWGLLQSLLSNQLCVISIKEYFQTILTKLTEKLFIEPSKSNVIFRYRPPFIVPNIMKELSIPIGSKISLDKNQDFAYFKEFPFIELNSIEYAVISNDFIINQLYLSLRFRLSKLCRQHKIMDFPNRFNDEFIGEFLIGGLIEYIYGNKADCLLTDHKCKEMESTLKTIFHKNNPNLSFSNAIDSPPDGYIRNNGNIILIECKGKILNTKALDDTTQCLKELKKDLVGKKGTGQLLKNMLRIINNQFLWDDSIPAHIKIYPILIVDDSAFMADGFNRFVIDSTKDEIEKNKRVLMPITIIDIDTFILSADLIRDGQINLENVIERYHSYINGEFDKNFYTPLEFISCKNVSFSTFIMSQYELRSPKIVKDMVNRLLTN